MVQFFETKMGSKFFNSDFPRMVRAVEKLAEEVEVLNSRLKEKNEEDKTDVPGREN